MTGFARSHDAHGDLAFEWELKSVNAKGLDVRLRLPPGFDAIEAPARKRLSGRLARGTVYANLSVRRTGAATTVRVNEDVLEAVVAQARALAARLDGPPLSVDGLLAIKGVLEVAEPETSEAADEAAHTMILAALDTALRQLLDMRGLEGETLGRILLQRMDDIEQLAARAEAAPGRAPEAIKARLAAQVATLFEASDRFDADRLAQEAVLLAARADIREELDRIASHVAQARALIGKGGAVGRRLDFLAQEFNREVNTCCSKSNDIELTNIGLELKSVVEQFREQVQNLE
jgi:uncharacterized protein (TIGR00255 family)